MSKGYNSGLIIAPSETIKEVMNDRGFTCKTLSVLSGITVSEIEDLLSDKKHIDIRIGEGLQKATGIRASFWMNLSKRYLARLEAE